MVVLLVSLEFAELLHLVRVPCLEGYLEFGASIAPSLVLIYVWEETTFWDQP